MAASQISPDRIQLLISRYQHFLSVVDNTSVEPVKVFDKLSPKAIQELELIREVSKDLQIKKEDDRLAQLAKQNAVVEESKEQQPEAPKDDTETSQA